MNAQPVSHRAPASIITAEAAVAAAKAATS